MLRTLPASCGLLTISTAMRPMRSMSNWAVDKENPTDRRLRLLLESKNAVIYGGGGSIGGAVARAFAREGAKVHLAGRTLDSLEKVAEEIRSAGGVADTAQVDALDEAAVDRHADALAASAGSIDISFNLISHGDVQGTPLAEMPLADFERPVATAVRTMFLTSRAAARQMIRQGSGVILVFGGYGDPTPDHYLGGLQVAFQAMETLRRQLASELGRHGIRTVTLQTGGIPESIPEGFEGREAITKEIEEGTMLKRAATLDDVGNVAAFAASDQARPITASAINITCGSVVD
jgi:NAD(P)-dependent dehydrogenase (short-subunit alcohol dehydrogenase family)